MWSWATSPLKQTFQTLPPNALLHNHDRHISAFVFHRLLDLGSETPVLPFDAAEAADDQVVELLCHAGRDIPAALANISLAFVAWTMNEVTGEAEAILGKGDPLDSIIRQLCHAGSGGKIGLGRTYQIAQDFNKMIALFLGYDTVLELLL